LWSFPPDANCKPSKLHFKPHISFVCPSYIEKKFLYSRGSLFRIEPSWWATTHECVIPGNTAYSFCVSIKVHDNFIFVNIPDLGNTLIISHSQLISISAPSNTSDLMSMIIQFTKSRLWRRDVDTWTNTYGNQTMCWPVQDT
jgi:hypothetical protein